MDILINDVGITIPVNFPETKLFEANRIPTLAERTVLQKEVINNNKIPFAVSLLSSFASAYVHGRGGLDLNTSAETSVEIGNLPKRVELHGIDVMEDALLHSVDSGVSSQQKNKPK